MAMSQPSVVTPMKPSRNPPTDLEFHESDEQDNAVKSAPQPKKTRVARTTLADVLKAAEPRANSGTPTPGEIRQAQVTRQELGRGLWRVKLLEHADAGATSDVAVCR